MRYACIARHQGEYPVRLMCRVLHVSPAGFYAGAAPGPESPRADGRPCSACTCARTMPRATARMARRASPKRSRRRACRAAGTAPRASCASRASRAWPRAACACRPLWPTRRIRTRRTRSRATSPWAPRAAALDRRWAADVTYVPTWAGWLYLAVVLDLASRRVIGWAMGPSLAHELPLAALTMARQTRRPAPGALHHSDQGRQYSSAGYRAALAAAGLTASMSRRGDCWDNAVVESFFATLKTELIHRRPWATRAEVQRAVFRYIEGWYNPHRLHSALGYQSPAQYEATLLTRSRVA